MKNTNNNLQFYFSSACLTWDLDQGHWNKDESYSLKLYCVDFFHCVSMIYYIHFFQCI